jgi:superfamily II DNA or RNA helicase
MALRQEPVRLLIADDVGIGKTVEACLISRELLDRGEIERIAVLCPPHLAEQWQGELKDKFHIEAELVLPSTAPRLERGLPTGESLFHRYPCVVVSMDFIKSDRRRDEFARACPEFVIVDEAHTCAVAAGRGGGRHQRHQLIKTLSQGEKRHVVLVTATPHSGKEEAFRSLLALLKPEFVDLPHDLAGEVHRKERRKLARHFVQRTRADIRHFANEDTPFPDREDAEASYELTPEYRALFDRALKYARETVADPEGGHHRQRVRWWSALALLRSLASSPAAAAATLRNRASTAETESVEDADEIGRRTVLDLESDDLAEVVDVAPGADPEAEGGKSSARQRLLALARDAEKLQGEKDAKLSKAVGLIAGLVKDGFRPIVFCRFIPTAEYVARELRDRVPRPVTVEAVTGLHPPANREARVLELAKAAQRVLVATDCLSEGINLQEHFDAVMHYDLAWSPTRHEQRAGRVDRYSQPQPKVRVLTYFGKDNRIDGIVLDVLLRKHKAIRSSTGVSIPVPVDSNEIVEAIFEGLLLREQGSIQDVLPGLEEYLKPKREDLHVQWDAAAERERRSRSVFAQESLKVDEVAAELEEARRSAGSARDVERFSLEALTLHRAVVTPRDGRYELRLTEAPRALRDLMGVPDEFAARFDLPVQDGEVYLSRTHPYVEGLAAHVMDTALDEKLDSVARRCGAVRTAAVQTRTALLVVRFRFDVVSRRSRRMWCQLGEECRVLAFRGAPDQAEWLDDREAETLLDAEPGANILPEQASDFVRRVCDAFDGLRPRLEEEAWRRAAALVEAHSRVRKAANVPSLAYEAEPQLPPDVLGIYVLLPVPAGDER